MISDLLNSKFAAQNNVKSEVILTNFLLLLF